MRVIYNPSGKAGEYSKWAVNIYNGCAHGCYYCYAPAIARKTHEDFQRQVSPRSRIVENIEHDLDKYGHEIDSAVLFCFMCDAYQPMEKETGLARRCLELFVKYAVPVQVLTKGTDIAIRDFDLLETSLENMFAVTLTHRDSEVLSRIEPRASSYQSRVSALKLAKERGIFTWVSLEPVVKVEETLQIIEEVHPYVDHFKVGKLNHDPLQKRIDWSDFKKRAIAILEKHKKSYYIKRDLSVY